MVNIDTRSRDPIYLQIEKQIIKLINLGVYESNCPLPSVRAMALELGINPNTVAKAYKNLEARNVIYTVVGKGVFVGANNDNQIRQLILSQFERVVRDAKNTGIDKNDVISIVDNIWKENNDD